MMHVLLRTSQEAYAAAVRKLAIEHGLWAGHPRLRVTADPLMLRMELSVGDATCALKPAEIRGIFAELVGQNQQDPLG